MNDPFFSRASQKVLPSKPARQHQKDAKQPAANKRPSPGPRLVVEKLEAASSESESYSEQSDDDKNPEMSKGRAKKIKEEESEDDVDAGSLDRELVAARLLKDARLSARNYKSTIANLFGSTAFIARLNSADLKGSLSSIAVQGPFCFSVSKKSLSVVQFDLEKKLKINSFFVPKEFINKYPNFTSVAVSSDLNYVAAAGSSTSIFLWNAASGKFIKRIDAHRKGITGISFRMDSENIHLYSSSLDRSVKVWLVDGDSVSFVDSLLGHLEGPMNVDSLIHERCITSGGRDKSIRIYKIVEGTQLVFNANQKHSRWMLLFLSTTTTL